MEQTEEFLSVYVLTPKRTLVSGPSVPSYFMTNTKVRDPTLAPRVNESQLAGKGLTLGRS